MLTIPVEELDKVAGIFLVTIKYHTGREKSDLKYIFTEVVWTIFSHAVCTWGRKLWRQIYSYTDVVLQEYIYIDVVVVLQEYILT